MSWTAEIQVFEGEDLEALKQRFAELWATYGDRTPLEVAEYVFRDLPEPFARAAQAAALWSKDLAILQRVKEARKPTTVASKDEVSRELLELARCERAETKDRVNAYKLFGEMQGWIGKVGAPEGGNADKVELFAALAEALPS